MAQESVSDLLQIAKDLAKAEKELKVESWVMISICRYDNQGNCSLLFRYDLPREVYNRWQWVVRWREARCCCQYPRDRIDTSYSFYDKRLGTNYQLNEDLKTLAAAKAQVTKVTRAITEYIDYQRTHNLFFSEDTDELLLKTKAKLKVKEANVKEAEKRMYKKIKAIKEHGKKYNS